MTTSDNPLLDFDSLPAFSRIEAAHMQPAVAWVIDDNLQRLDTLLNDTRLVSQPDWDSLMRPLEEFDDRLEKVWSVISHLNGTCNTPEIREAHSQCQALVTDYRSRVGQNESLFRAVRTVRERADELELDTAQRKVLDDMLLEFEHAGVSLPPEKKKEFAALQSRLSSLSSDFGNNVLDATRAWTEHVTDRSLLAGIPELNIQAAAETAADKGLDGYLLTLDFPCYFAVMSNAEDEGLRERMHRAFVTRASDQDASGGQWDNTPIMRQILECREQMAALLGYGHYAEMSVARKMARSVDEVNQFLDDLIRYTRPAAERDFEALQAFARERDGRDTLAPWDIAFYSEQLRRSRYDISQDALRVWFPVERVLQGLFEVTGKLFGVRITTGSADTWHPDVRFCEIHRQGELVARFYLDLYTREGKRGGAWMADCHGRRRRADGSDQIPVAFLTCNFAPPGRTRPALLSHDEVTTLFHEFGHGLHHMLTVQPHLRCSGINGVAWDAVELPSQLLENWCWEPEALPLISAHYETGEPLPADMLDRMLAARNFQAGMFGVRQLEFALFDFSLHQQSVQSDPAWIGKVLQQARERTSVAPVARFNRFENSFGHIFAGGYAAGYYSYKWAEVLSADVYSRFTESGIFDQATGQAFFDKILSKGGGNDALTLFTDFMGREPDVKSLLKQEGLLQEP
ncbi:MAG: M3 family metallopeptidase [Pseudohongiellaceae bacterium]